jgi:hypothetical protein
MRQKPGLLFAREVGFHKWETIGKSLLSVNASSLRNHTLQRMMLRSKIHRATVTQADLHYVGSLTVDADLMKAADLLPGEQVQVVDINNGARLETDVIEGPRGSGIIGINGAAACLVHPGRSCHRHELCLRR